MTTPAPPATVVQRLARACLRLMGWRVVSLPALPAKAVLIAYPHTSNWDFVHTMLGKAALGLNAHWVGKDTLFRWPLGSLMRALGGIPVNRRERTGFVDAMAARYAHSDQLIVAIAPEGTRGLTPGWKTGFYRIARAARVPILLACVDYGRREVGVIGSLLPTENAEADMAAIAAAYAGRRGRYPDQAAPIVLIGGDRS